jgi:predicted ester cyclase
MVAGSRITAAWKEGAMTLEQTAVVSPQLGNSGMTRDEIVAFIERRQALYDEFDAAGLAADYADDVVVESPMAGVHTGRAAAERALRTTFETFLDLKMKTDALLIDGDRAALFVTTEVTHMRESVGGRATGKPFSLSLVFMYEFKDRKIVRERRIYDFTGLLVQIGLLKAKPA